MLNVGHGRPFLMVAENVAWVWKRPAMADIFNFENYFWVQLFMANTAICLDCAVTS